MNYTITVFLARNGAGERWNVGTMLKNGKINWGDDFMMNTIDHSGIKGMKWGTRRWQYYDGRFKPEGKLRYFGQTSLHRPPSVEKLQDGTTSSSKKKTLPQKTIKKNLNNTKASTKNIKTSTSSGGETSKPSTTRSGGGSGSTLSYDDWEDKMYTAMKNGNVNVDFSKMSEEDFAKYLSKYAGINPNKLTTSALVGMKNRAARNYSSYSANNGTSTQTTSVGKEGDKYGIISDKFGQSNSKSSSSSKKSGGSGGSSGSKGTEGKTTATQQGAAITTQDSGVDVDSYTKKLGDMKDDEIKKLTGGTISDFRKAMEKKVGIDLSKLSDDEVELLRIKVKNHYAMKTWENDVKSNMVHIMKKYPAALTNSNSFVKALTVYTGVDYRGLTVSEFRDMRNRFAELYIDYEKNKNVEHMDGGKFKMNNYYTNELYHHGIKGMKWGVRRYQNPDGSLTAAGRERYGSGELAEARDNYRDAKKEYNRAYNKAWWLNAPHSVSKKRREATKKRWDDVYDKANDLEEAKKKYKTEKGLSDLEKSIARVNSERDKTLSARSRNLEKMSAKWQKKVDSGKKVPEYASYKKKDFDAGTEMVKRGYQRYSDVISTYKRLKIKAVNDPSIKKTKAYRNAGKAYAEQAFFTAYYGLPMTVLMYAGDEAVNVLDKK